MNGLCTNYGFEKSCASATYIFEKRIDDKSLRLEIGIKLNFISFVLSIDHHSNHNNDFSTVENKKKPKQILYYNFLINSDIVDNRIFIMTSKDVLDNLEMVRMLDIMKEDIFDYVKKYFPELNNVIRKKKIKKVLDNE